MHYINYIEQSLVLLTKNQNIFIQLKESQSLQTMINPDGKLSVLTPRLSDRGTMIRELNLIPRGYRVGVRARKVVKRKLQTETRDRNLHRYLDLGKVPIWEKEFYIWPLLGSLLLWVSRILRFLLTFWVCLLSNLCFESQVSGSVLSPLFLSWPSN